MKSKPFLILHTPHPFSISMRPLSSSAAGALVGAGSVCREERDLSPLAPKESALHCSSGFMGTVGAEFSPGVQICQIKALLMETGLSVPALPVLRNHTHKSEREGVFYRASPARQEDCLWLSAERGDIFCPSAFFPIALSSCLSDTENNHTHMLP